MSRSIALFVVLAAACSSDEDAPAATTRFTVVVVEEPLLLGDPIDRPIAGADVAFDPPGGDESVRVVAITDDAGRATFELPPEQLRGGAAVTVFSPAHLSYSALDVTGDTVTLVVPRLDAAAGDRTLFLGGTISGRSPLGSNVDLSTSKLDRLGRTTTLTPTFSFRIPRAQPFFILGHEQLESGSLVKSFRIDVPAKDADTRLDVDLASVPVLAPRSVHVRVEPPAAMGADAKVSANVLSAESSLHVGTQVKAEGRDVEMSVVDTDLGGEHAVTRALAVAVDGSQSFRSELGVVGDGTTWSDLVAPPTIPEGSRLKTDPIPLADFPDGADLRVEMIAGGKLGWILVGPRGGLRTKTIALPPSFKVDFPALVAVTIAAQLDRVEVAPGRAFYRRVGVSRDVLLHR